MPQGFEVDTLSPQNISTVAADVGAEMIDFDDTTHDAAFVQFEVDTDNTFPNPTQLGSDADLGLISQNNQVLKRSDDLMPDTDYFIRAQAENVVYSDDTLFSSAAKSSQGFINDISDKDLSNAAAEPLASEAMTQFTTSRSNLLTYSNVVSDFWSLDSPTQAFWSNGSFNQDNTQFGLWQADVDLSGVSNLNVKIRGGAPLGSNLTAESSHKVDDFLGNDNARLYYNPDTSRIYVRTIGVVRVIDTTDMSLTGTVSTNGSTWQGAYMKDNGNFLLAVDGSYYEIDETATLVASGGFNNSIYGVCDAPNNKVYTHDLTTIYEYDDSYSQTNSFSTNFNIQDIVGLDNHLFVLDGENEKLVKFDYSGTQVNSVSPDSMDYNNTILGSDSLILTYNRNNGSLEAFNTSDLSQAWSVTINSDLQSPDPRPRDSTDLFFQPFNSNTPQYVRVGSGGSIIYDKTSDSNVAGHAGAGSDVFVSGEGLSPDIVKYSIGSLDIDITVRADSTNLIQTGPNSNYSQESADVSGLSGVKTLYLGIDNFDLSPNNYAQGQYNGATGSGNSLYVYSDTGSVGGSNIFAEFSDITFT